MNVWPFHHKTRILAIDDEAGFTRLLQLAAAQYEVRGENDPLRAIETAKEFKPDLILLDRIMPGMTGDKLAVSFKRHPQLKDIPIAFLTATPPDGEDGSTHTFRGCPVLAKPVTMEAINRCVQECVKR
ncbi:MAG TPA: response regulator [Chthoniobacter sp.]|jgi:CheY-like chemotaxis protein